MRAALYLRVSTDAQAGEDRFSIPAQLAACERFANEKGYSIVATFREDFTSRELERPALDELRTFVRRGNCDVVIVWALDRLARHPAIRWLVEQELGESDVRVEYVSADYSQDEEGEVRKDIEGAFARWENAARVRRANIGKLHKAKAGKYVGGKIPRGYVADRDAPSGLAIDEDEAKVIRQVFELYATQQRSLNEVAKTTGLKRTTVHRTLKATIYIGKAFYNRRRRKSRTKSVERDPSEWVTFEVPPIVDPLTFQRAQERLSHNRKSLRKHETFFMLRGMVRCKKCGRSLSCEMKPAGKGRPNAATLYRHRANDCKGFAVSGRVLEERVWGFVVLMLGREEMLRDIYEMNTDQAREKAKTDASRIGTLEQTVQKAQDRHARMMNLYLDGGLPKAEYLNLRTQLEAERRKAEAELVKSREQATAEPPSWEQFESWVETVRTALTSGEIMPDTKRLIFEGLQVEIRLDGGLQGTISGLFQRRQLSTPSTQSEQPPVTFTYPIDARNPRDILKAARRGG